MFSVMFLNPDIYTMFSVMCHGIVFSPMYNYASLFLVVIGKEQKFVQENGDIRDLRE